MLRHLSSRRSRRSRPSVDFLEARSLLNAGALDTTFGGTGMVSTLIQNGNPAAASAVQSDLKVVVVGSTSTGTNPAHFTIVRYNSDGTLDSSFGKGGIAIVSISPVLGENATAVAIQPRDGKIVVAGTALFPGKKKGTEIQDWAVARLNTNGSLDTTFGGGSGYVLTGPPMVDVSAIALQIDGKIVVAGAAAAGSSSGIGLVRYNSDGTLDSTFGNGGEVINAALTYGMYGQMVAIDSAGDIDVASTATIGTTSEMGVARYLPTGTLDSTFGNGGVVDVLPTGYSVGLARSVALQSTGKIVVYGQGNFGSRGMVPTLVRLNTSGTIDTTFGSDGFYNEPRMAFGTSLVIQPSNDMIVAVANGWSNGLRDRNYWVTRVLADGSSYDAAFGTNGLGEAPFGGPTGIPITVSLAPDGNIVVSGSYQSLGGPFTTARFLGASTGSASVLATSATTAGGTDRILGALVLDVSTIPEPPFTSQHRRSV